MSIFFIIIKAFIPFPIWVREIQSVKFAGLFAIISVFCQESEILIFCVFVGILAWIDFGISGVNTTFMMTSSMETFPALLAICAGNSPVTGEFPTQRPWWSELWCFLWAVPWINGWVDNREAGDSRRHRAHYDVIEISQALEPPKQHTLQVTPTAGTQTTKDVESLRHSSQKIRSFINSLRPSDAYIRQ